MNFLSFIESKRDGQSLAPEHFRDIVSAVVEGTVPDYQLAAFLMAVFFRGLNTAETTALTLAMRDSGEVLKFPEDERPLVDKHSTGGVGDKVSLPLAPLLACLGFRVPMISGRALGITGGTLDKLDSIPGLKTVLPAGRITEIVQTVGCVICGQTDRMVPADKKLYGLRDVTGTVPSIPLIVASILSKKLAEGLDALVLDVKFGRAAFMQTKADARKLAKAMVALGNQCGVNTRAVLTDMNTPLGRAVGNWLEVKESVAVLDLPRPASSEPGVRQLTKRADSPQRFPPLREAAGVASDVRELVLSLAAHLLVQAGKASSTKAARKRAENCLDSGAPRRKWDDMLLAQGANLSAFNRKLALDSTAPIVVELKSPRAGFVTRCDARLIGEVIRDLGAGRLTKEAVINHDVGVDQLTKPGEPVKAGSILVRIHTADRAQADTACARLNAAFEVSARPPLMPPLISEVVTG